MERFVKGDVVVVPFPFSDLSAAKKRPALVLANLAGDDIILCQITSQCPTEPTAIALTAAGFASGGLPANSYVRPTRIFTADKSIIIRKAGSLTPDLIGASVEQIVSVLQR
jgi:mRNA interferase MazF